MIEWNNGRNFEFLDWMPLYGSIINRDLKKILQEKSLDRINFKISDESLNNRRLELTLDESINALIDN